MEIKEEIWKDIPGYEGYYQASTFGNIKSVERYIDRKGKRIHIKERILSPERTATGYLRVGLYKDGKQRLIRVHKLVAETFLENSKNYKSINHKDENPMNNNVENLEFCNHKYNNNYGSHGEKISKANGKPVMQFDLNGTFIKEFDSAKIAAIKTNCNSSWIVQCCLGKIKKHKGFLWKYKNNDTRNNAVYQFTKNGEFIGKYKNASEAEKYTNVKAYSIRLCCKEMQNTAGGYIWKYSN